MSQAVIRGQRALSILLSLDVRDAGERVLELLAGVANLKELPASGWFAGQAVATAIEAIYLGLREARYNDVDHFVAEREDEATMGGLGVGVSHEAVQDYGQVVLSSRARYWVQRSQQEGMVNRVDVVLASNQAGVFDSDESHLQAGRELIDGFDFNSVQAGVDLVTRRLFWSPEFAQFIQTRQLEVVSMHTPAHTAVRVLKKLEEQPDLWCDLPRVMAGLAGAIDLAMLREQKGEGAVVFCRTLLGPAIAARARRYQAKLAPFFELIEVERVRHDVEGSPITVRYTTLKPKSLPADDFMSVAAVWPQPLYAQLTRLFMRPAKPLRKAKVHALFGPSGEGARDAIAVIAGTCGFEHVIERAASPRQIEDAFRFIRSHPRLSAWLVAVARSWDELQSTIQWVRLLAKQEGLASIGVLETAIVPSMAEIPHYEERLRLMHATYKDRREEIARIPTRARELDNTSIGGVFVRQLLTGLDLLEEGSQMRHCVGGYTHSLSDPRIVLLSLRGDPQDKTTWSTAEVQFRRRFAVSVSQHRGRFNVAPPAANEEALNEVCDLLLKARAARATGIPSLALARRLDQIDQALRRARNRLQNAIARRRNRRYARLDGDEIPW